ncbi:hypothetical protein BE17_49425 [Sorangium cellulosum]|uniref:Uncharacterized protein n=1 Tax=Sorangium cellulosum TaxID=56 RepID=A0A150RVI7_SORCE|nr:hypothetical protein BE17_49425 [Sorangium cellulosum]
MTVGDGSCEPLRHQELGSECVCLDFAKVTILGVTRETHLSIQAAFVLENKVAELVRCGKPLHVQVASRRDQDSNRSVVNAQTGTEQSVERCELQGDAEFHDDSKNIN